MKNAFLKYLFLLAILGFSTSYFAQETRKYSNEFLSIGVGARALGMSNSVVASSNDVHSAYWNPAGLTGVTGKVQGSLMHSEYFAGIANFDYGAAAIPIESGVIGISLIRFGVDDIQNTVNLIDPNTGQPDYNRIEKFSAADYAALISFAKKLKVEGLSAGGSAKIIHRQIGDFAEAWGFGIDLGVRYEKNNWLVGASARDVTSTFNAWSYSLDDRTKEVFLQTDNELPQNDLEITPPRLIVGGGYKIFFGNDKFRLLPELNADITFDGQRQTVIQSNPVSVDPHFGLEFSYDKLIYLRGGVGNFQRVKAEVGNYKETTFQPNLGVGLYLRNILGLGDLAIDYALTDVGSTSGLLYSNVFSLKFHIHE